jgi:hypothetical protein
MADAQDLKSWDLKQSCGFESRHRHQFYLAEFQQDGATRKASASESASEIITGLLLNHYPGITRQPLAKMGFAVHLV